MRGRAERRVIGLGAPVVTRAGLLTARMASTGVLVLVALAGAVGCDQRARPDGAERSGATLGAMTIVTTPTGVGTSPTFVLSSGGTRAIAWVSAPAGGTDGRLYVS